MQCITACPRGSLCSSTAPAVAGTGFRGTTEVSVTVKDGMIIDITVESYADDDQFFGKAQSGIIDAILSEQTINVDTVSGATFSGNGIIEAVANAMGSSPENLN
ncbi:MAG: FMN-binding protein [Saccharofermentanales bacterium]